MPDRPEFTKLFEINDEVQTGMLFFMEDYLNFIRTRLLALEESLKFFTEDEDDEMEANGIDFLGIFD